MIKARVKQKDPSAEIILFGSHARGQAPDGSDWDILVLIMQDIVNHYLEKFKSSEYVA